MSTHGVGVFGINSKFVSGSLVYYEKAVGRTTTGDVLTIGTAAVKVGNTAQDVDFQWYGTGSISAILDAGDSSFTLVGVNLATNAPVVITDATESTSTSTGALIVSGGIGFAKDMYVGDDVFFSSGAVLNFNAGDVTLTHSANTLTLAGGQFYMAGGVSIVGIKLGTLSSTTPGSGLTIDDTTTRGLEVNVDDNNAARSTGTQGRAIFGRTMVYADNACEDWGIHGLSKVSGVAKTGNVSAGVVGAFESTGTCSIATGQGNSYFAGVMGRVGGGGTFTITSSNVVGVLSFYNTTTANNFTGTGTCAFMAVASEIAGTGNWDYGLYIKDSVYGIECQAEPTATGRIAKFSGTIAAPNLGDGYGAVEIDTTFTGTYAGISAALSAWVNITGTGAVGANIVAAQNNGIYADSGANTGSIVIFGMRAQAILTDAPTVLAPFSINTSNRAITALFEMNSNPDVGYQANAGETGPKVGDVPLFCDAAGQQYFVRIYSARG